ncbi:MAG: hypothetical protein AB8G16_15215 [Gammaproteobacteria bacterium]
MTNSLLRVGKSAALALCVAMFALPASAATLNGALTFSGDWVIGDGSSLADTTLLLFPGSDFDADGAVGTFADLGIVEGDTGMLDPLSLDLSGGSISLLDIAGVNFTLDTISIATQDATFLLVTGTGTLSAAGFDDTAATFFFSANTIGDLNVFSSGITAVPVPGAVWLFGSALMALGVRRKA